MTFYMDSSVLAYPSVEAAKGSMRRRICTAVIFAFWCALAPAAAESKMQDFLGRWEFSECWSTVDGGAKDCVLYRVDISPASGRRTIVDIDIDGYMSMSSIRAEGELVGNDLKILYVEDREPGLGRHLHKAGDVLLELSFHDGKVYTTWGEIGPQLHKSQKRCVCFSKVGKATGLVSPP
jgi:Family of unknown function (DUF5991)